MSSPFAPCIDDFYGAKWRLDAAVGQRSLMYGSVRTGLVLATAAADSFQIGSSPSSDLDLTFSAPSLASAGPQNKEEALDYLQALAAKICDAGAAPALEARTPSAAGDAEPDGGGQLIFGVPVERPPVAGRRVFTKYRDVRVVDARVPLIRCEEDVFDEEKRLRFTIRIEITMNNMSAVRNSNLIAQYTTCDFARALALRVKLWARSERLIRDMTNGLLSSYTYTLMTISFLQVRGLLPDLLDGEHQARQDVGERWTWGEVSGEPEVTGRLQMYYNIRTSELLGGPGSDAEHGAIDSERLVDFLEQDFFAWLDFRARSRSAADRTIMSVRGGLAPDYGPRAGCALAVQDPFVRDRAETGGYRVLRCSHGDAFQHLAEAIGRKAGCLSSRLREEAEEARGRGGASEMDTGAGTPSPCSSHGAALETAEAADMGGMRMPGDRAQMVEGRVEALPEAADVGGMRVRAERTQMVEGRVGALLEAWKHLDEVTPEGVDLVADEIARLEVRGAEEVGVVAQLIYDGAVADVRHCASYARVAERLGLRHPEYRGDRERKGVLQRALMKICQDGFVNLRHAQQLDAIAEGGDRPGAQPGEAIRTASARDIASIRFVGHLYLHRSVPTHIITSVAEDLVYIRTPGVRPSEFELECAYEFMRVIGGTWEAALARGRGGQGGGRDRVDRYFERLLSLIAAGSGATDGAGGRTYSHRICALIQELLVLRSSGWGAAKVSGAERGSGEVFAPQPRPPAAADIQPR